MFQNLFKSDDRTRSELFNHWRPLIKMLLMDLKMKTRVFGDFILVEDYAGSPTDPKDLFRLPNVGLMEERSYYGILVNTGEKPNCLRAIAFYKGARPGNAGFAEVESDPINPSIDPLRQNQPSKETAEVIRFLTEKIMACAEEVVTNKRDSNW